MTVNVVTVHPEVTIVKSDTRQFELPTKAFPTRPAPGQTWEIHLNPVLHESDQRNQLNQYLRTE